jgi:hypothetical protein
VLPAVKVQIRESLSELGSPNVAIYVLKDEVDDLAFHLTPLSHVSMLKKVTKVELRKIWNDPKFQSDLLRRTQQRVDVYEGLAPPSANQKPGTISHVYNLVNNDEREVLGTFHVYKEPGGTIGASGMHDPVFLLVDGVRHTDP